MKKLFTVWIALLLAVSVGACANKNTQSGQTSGSSLPAGEQEPQASGDAGEKAVSDEELAAKMEQMYAGEGAYADLPVVTMQTSEGTVKIRLFPEQAPKTVENFIGLIKKGYYDGITFHRVINEFMIQSGDPTATGTGGESLYGEPFEDEFSDLLHNYRGSLSMANAGYGTNGSQFFIVQSSQAIQSDEDSGQALLEMYMNKEVYGASMKLLAAQKEGKSEEELNNLIDDLNGELSAKEEAGVPADFAQKMQPVLEKYKKEGGVPYLDYKHTVFGYVFEGMDVVDKIAAVQTGESDKPVQDVVITKMTVEGQ